MGTIMPYSAGHGDEMKSKIVAGESGYTAILRTAAR